MIIDTFSYKKINQYFYGFMITKENKIIEKYNNEEETHNGCYFLIKKENNKTIISQDFFGCFGCYIYQENNYFAISNCLQELIIFLKDRNITLNKKYYSILKKSREVSFLYNETICNEIKRYNGSYIIAIENNKLIIQQKEEKINSINYDDENYLKILDSWYNRWIKVIQNLSNEIIIQDLSGGIDTRILLSISKNANMLNNIIVRNKRTRINEEAIEDEKIGLQLINDYKLKEIKKIFINKETNEKYNYIVGNSNFTASINSKPAKKIYRLCGNGGLLYHMPSIFEELLSFRYSIIDKKIKKEYNKIISTFQFPNYITEKNLKELFLYRKLIVELRDGIKSADYYRNKTIMLCPMMDPELNLLNPLDKNGRSILPIIILKKYCKDLLNYPIEGINKKNLDLNIEEIKYINNFISTNKQEKKVYFLRNKETIINKDGSHSTGTNFKLSDSLLEYLKNDS